MSSKKNTSSSNFSFTRRDFIAFSSGAAATSILGSPSLSFGQSDKKKKKSDASSKKTSQPNILFVFTDQERYFNQLPKTFELPGHTWLAERGTTFTSHTISSCMCTSSRSVMLTGLQTPNNGMFENVDMPYTKNLSTQIPTIGHMLRKAGYYTAYKGKWHLNRDFESPAPGVNLNTEMEKYGFADFYSPGDHLAHALGGYHFDHMIAGGATAWLRNKGSHLNSEGKPWSLFVSLINPHDIMYFNADAPNENIQDTGKLLMEAERAPNHASYLLDWQQSLPQNLRQPVDERGRPAAHAEYDRAWGYALGRIPLRDENWHRFTNFYLNSIKTVDQQLAHLFYELDALGLANNTIVVFTSDHGDMAGSHGLRGKGPFAYKESIHVPLYVVHPDTKGGQTCQSLTSHIDLVPSLLSMAGVKPQDVSSLAGQNLPGKDFSSVLSSPSSANLNDVRAGALFTYSGLATNDSELIRIITEAKANGKDPKVAIKESGYQPNLKKRGSLRSVFDGRYKFTRYFSPLERHRPKDLNDLLANNDVELFDLQQDPAENINLAIDPVKNKLLLETMSGKLETAIAQEIGIDDGREMPDFPNIEWTLDRLDL